MIDDPYADLEIPEFLRRAAAIPPARTGVPITNTIADYKPTDPLPAFVGEIVRAVIDPKEILRRKIEVEADRRWRSWLPTKHCNKRPRLGTFRKQVRKELKCKRA